jgi:hypothetical protein
MIPTPGAPASGERRALLAAILAAAALLSGCAGVTTTFPPIGSTPQPAGDATAAARQQVVQALGAVGLQPQDSVRPYRPAEGPLLAAAPRSVIEAPLQRDPDPALVVIYALASPDAALAAAKDDADYLRSNTGGIQVAPGTQVVLQVVGSNVIFFSWLPADSPDPATATIAQALSKIGEPVPVTP